MTGLSAEHGFKLPDRASGPIDDTSATLHGKPMKSYNPNFVYKGPWGHKLTLPNNSYGENPKTQKTYDACSPYVLSNHNFYTFGKLRN